MTDVELAALSALVNAVAGLPGHGRDFEPDWAALSALRLELRRRGILPRDESPEPTGATS